MMCEKCQNKAAKVRILKLKGDSEDGLGAPLEQHLCEDCARDYIRNAPRFKRGEWSKPTKHFVLDVSPGGL